MTRRAYSNVALPVYLIGGLDGNSTTNIISVSLEPNGTPAAPSGWPTTYPFFAAIDYDEPGEEIVLVTAGNAGSLTISRGTSLGALALGSTTKAHQPGAKLIHVATGADYDEANAHVSASTAVHGLAAGSAVVGTSDTQTLTNKTLGASTTLSGGGLLVGASNAQTLTNKTLTSPTITGAVMSTPTITGMTSTGGTLTGATLTGATITNPAISGSITLESLHARGPVHDVMAFGATGDVNTASDSTAIQAAIDSAAAYGGTVYFPPGTYNNTVTLHLPSNCSIILAPGATLRRAANVTMMVNAVPTDNFPVYGGNSNIYIGGSGTIDMRGVAQSGRNNGLTFAHCSNITVEGITIKDMSGYHAIEFNGVKTGRVKGVKFLGYVDTTGGDNFYKESIQIDLAKGTAQLPYPPPYDNTICDDILIESCTFGPSGTSGTTAPNSAFGGHSGTVGVRHTNIRFVNNYCDSLRFWICSTYAMSRVTILGNTASGCQRGIRVNPINPADPDDTLNTAGTQTSASQSEFHFTVAGNHLVNTVADDAITVVGNATGTMFSVAVQNNIIDTTTASTAVGINIEYGDRVVVTGNLINSSGSVGILIDHSNNVVVSNNGIRNTGDHGVYLSTCTNMTVNGNQINTTKNDGIQVCLTSKRFTINNNNLTLIGIHGINVFSGCTDFIVVGNVVVGASRITNNVSSAFRSSSNCTRGTWALNRALRFGSGNDYAHALSFTGTCTAYKHFGNSLQDGVGGANTALDDQSTSPDLTAGNTTMA